jgi:hypothetical protein
MPGKIAEQKVKMHQYRDQKRVYANAASRRS